MEKEVNSNSFEYKVRTIKLEIREAKREKEKHLGIVIPVFLNSGICLGFVLYAFFGNYKPEEPWIIPATIFLGLASIITGIYWYNRYKKEVTKIEKLEKEIYLLKLKMKDKE